MEQRRKNNSNNNSPSSCTSRSSIQLSSRSNSKNYSNYMTRFKSAQEPKDITRSSNSNRPSISDFDSNNSYNSSQCLSPTQIKDEFISFRSNVFDSLHQEKVKSQKQLDSDTVRLLLPFSSEKMKKNPFFKDRILTESDSLPNDKPASPRTENDNDDLTYSDPPKATRLYNKDDLDSGQLNTEKSMKKKHSKNIPYLNLKNANDSTRHRRKGKDTFIIDDHDYDFKYSEDLNERNSPKKNSTTKTQSNSIKAHKSSRNINNNDEQDYDFKYSDDDISINNQSSKNSKSPSDPQRRLKSNHQPNEFKNEYEYDLLESDDNSYPTSSKHDINYQNENQHKSNNGAAQNSDEERSIHRNSLNKNEILNISEYDLNSSDVNNKVSKSKKQQNNSINNDYSNRNQKKIQKNNKIDNDLSNDVNQKNLHDKSKKSVKKIINDDSSKAKTNVNNQKNSKAVISSSHFKSSKLNNYNSDDLVNDENKQTKSKPNENKHQRSQQSNKGNSDDSNEVVNDIKDDSNEQNHTESNQRKSSKQQNSVINDSPNEKDKLIKHNKSRTDNSNQNPKTNSQNTNQATSKRHQKSSKQSNKDHNSDESSELFNDAKDDLHEQNKSESNRQKSSKQQKQLDIDSTNEKDKSIKQNQAKTDISDESSNTNSQNNNKTTSKKHQKSSKQSNAVGNSDDSNEARNNENDIDKQINSTSNTQKHQKSIKQSNKDNSDENDGVIKQKNKQSNKQQKMKDSSNEETQFTQINNQKSSKKDNQHSNDEYSNNLNETNDLIEQTNVESNKHRRQKSPKHQNNINNDPINEQDKSKQYKSKTNDFDETFNQKCQFNNQSTNQKTSKEHQRSSKQSNKNENSDDSNEVVNDENDLNLQRNSKSQKRQKSSKTDKQNSKDENSDESDDLIDQKNKTSNKQQMNNDSSNEETHFSKPNNISTNQKSFKKDIQNSNDEYSNDFNHTDDQIEQNKSESNKQKSSKQLNKLDNDESMNENEKFKQRKSKTDYFDESSNQKDKLNNQNNNQETSKEHRKSSKQSKRSNNSGDSNEIINDENDNIKQCEQSSKPSNKDNSDEINESDELIDQKNKTSNKQQVQKSTKQQINHDSSNEEENNKPHKKSSKFNQIKNNNDFDYSDNFKDNSKRSQKSNSNKFNDDSNEDDESNIQNDFVDKNRQKSHNIKHNEGDHNSDDSKETNDSNAKQKRDSTKTSKHFKQTSQNTEIDDQHNTKTISSNQKSNHVRNQEISGLNQYSDDLDETNTEHKSKGNKNKLSRKFKQLHKTSQNEEEDEIDEQHNGKTKKNRRKSNNSQNEHDEYDSAEINEKTNQRAKNISQNSKRRKNHEESELNQYSDEEPSQNQEDETHSNQHKSPHHHNNITTPSKQKSHDSFSHHMSAKDDTFLSQESDEIDFQFTSNYKERHLNSSIENNEVTKTKFIFPINPKFLWFPQNERTIRSTVKITATAPKIPKTIENPKQSKTRSMVNLTQEQPRRLVTQNDDFYSSLKYETESEIMTNDIIMKCKYFENFDGVLKFVKSEHPEFSEEPPFKDFSVEIVRIVDLLKIDKFDYFNKEESIKLVLVNPIITQDQFLVSPFNYCLTFDNLSIPNQKYLINPNKFINICKYRNQKNVLKLPILNKKCDKLTSFKVPQIKYQLDQNDNKRNYQIEQKISSCNDFKNNQNMVFKEKVKTFLISPTNYVLNSTTFTLIPIEIKDHLNQNEFRHEKDQTKEKMPQMISSCSKYLADQKSNYNVYSQKVNDIYSPQINSINDIRCYFIEDFYLDSTKQPFIWQITPNTFSIDQTNYSINLVNTFKLDSIQIKDHSNQNEFKHQKEQMKDKISKFINHCSKYLTNTKSDYNVFTHQINDIYPPKLNSIHDVKCYFIQDFYLDSPTKKVPLNKGQFNSPIDDHDYLIPKTSFQPNFSNFQSKKDEFHSNTSSPIIDSTSNYKLPMNHSNQIQSNIFHSNKSNYSIKQNSFKPSLPNLTIQENDFHSNLPLSNKTSNDTFQSQFDQIRIEKNQMKSTTSNAFNVNTTFNLFNQIDSIDSTKSDSFTINHSQYSDKNEVDCRSLQSIDNNSYKIKNARYISDKRCSFKSTTTFDYTECIQYDLNSIFPNLSLNELSESIKRKSQQNSYVQDDSSNLSDNQFVSGSFNLNSFSPISFKNIDGVSNQDFDQYLIQQNDFSPKSISPKSKQNIHQYSTSIKKSFQNEVNQSINEFDSNSISPKSKQTISDSYSIENVKKEYLVNKVNQSNDEFSVDSYSPQNPNKRSLTNKVNQTNDKQIKKSTPNEIDQSIDEFNQTTFSSKQDFNDYDYSIKQQFMNDENGFIDIKEGKSKEVDNLLPVIKDEELIPAYEMSLEFREQNKYYSNRNNKMNSQTEQYEIGNNNQFKTINSVYQSDKPQFQLNFIDNFHDETSSDERFKLPIHQFNNSYHIHQNDYQSLLSYGKPTKIFLNSMSRDVSLNETESEEDEEPKEEEEDIDEYNLLDPSIDLLDINTIPFKVFNLVEKDKKPDLKSVLYQSENSEEIKRIKVQLTEPKSDFSSFNNYDINNYNVNKSIIIDTLNQPKFNPSNFNISTDRNCITKVQDEFKGGIVNLRNKENQMKIDDENYIPHYIGDFVNFEEKLQINPNSFIEKSSIPQKVDSYSTYQNEQIQTPINFYSNNFKEIEIGSYQCIRTENDFKDSHQFSIPTSKFTSKTEKFREKDIDFVDNNCDSFNIPSNHFTDIQNSKFVTEKSDYHSTFDNYINKEIVFNIPKTQFQLKPDAFLENDNSYVHTQVNMHSEYARYHIDYNKFNEYQPLKFICDSSDRFNQTELELKLKSSALSVDKLCEQSTSTITDFNEKPEMSSYRNEVSEKISPKISSFAIVSSKTQYNPIVDKPIIQSSIFEDLTHSFKLPRTNLYTNFESQPKIGLKEKSDEYQDKHQDYELNSMKMQDEYLSPQTDLKQMTIANSFDTKEIFNKDGFEIEIDNNKLFTIHGDQKDFYQNETNAMKMPQMKLKLDQEKQTTKIDNNEFILLRTYKANQIPALTILPRNDLMNKENLFVDHKVADGSFVLKQSDFHTIETDLNDLQNDFRPIMHSNYTETKENPKVTSNDYIELNTLEMPPKTSLIDHNQSQFIDRSFELLASHIERFKLTDKPKKINNNPIDYLNEELLNGTNSFNTQSELSLIYMERTKQIVEVVEKTCDVGTQFIFNDSDDLTIENISINEIIEINQTEVQQQSQISNEIDDLTDIIEQPLNHENPININENQSHDSLNQNPSETDQSDTTGIQINQQIENNEIRSNQQIESNEMQSTQQIESNEMQTNENNEIQSNEQMENKGIESNEIQIIENIQSNELVNNEMQIIVDNNLNENIETEFIENALPINESIDITKQNSNDSTNQSTTSELNASIENNQIASMNEINDEKANEVIEELIHHSQNTDIDEINLEIDQLFDNSTEEIEITQSIDELEDIQIEIESFEESENRRTVSTQIIELIKTIQIKPTTQKPVKVEIEIFRDVDITQSEFTINKPITKRLLYLNKCRMNEFKCNQPNKIENQCEFISPIETFSIKQTELFNVLNDSNKRVTGNSFNVSNPHCADLINHNEFHCAIESYNTRNNSDLFQCQPSNSLDQSSKFDFQIQEMDCQNKLTKYTFHSSYLPEVAIINQINRCQLDEYQSIHSNFTPICNETVKLTKLESKTDKYQFTPTECKSTTDSYHFNSNISIPQPSYQLNQSNFVLNPQFVKSKTTTGFTSPIRSNEFNNEIDQFTENTSQYQSQSDQFLSSISCIDHIEPFTIKCGRNVNDIITKSIINNNSDDYKSNHSKFESKIEYLGHLAKIENDTEQIYKISTDQYNIQIEDNFESLQNLTGFTQTEESFKPKVQKVINDMNQFNDFSINEKEQQQTFISEISPLTNKLTKFKSTQANSMPPFKQTSFNLLLNVPKVQSKSVEGKVDENESPKRSRKKKLNKIKQTRSIKTQLSDNKQNQSSSHFDFHKDNLSEVDQKKRRIKHFLTNLSNAQITNDIMNDLTLSIISISGFDQNPATTQMNYKVFYRSIPFPLLSNECEEFSQLLNKLCLPTKSNRSVNGILSFIKPLLIRDENDLYPLNDYALLRSPLIRGQFKLLKVNNRPVSKHDENIFEIDLLINKEFITVNPQTRNINYTIPNCVITDDNDHQKLIIKAHTTKTRNSSSKLTEMQFTSSNQEEIRNWVMVFSKFQQKTFLLNHYLALLIQDSFDPNDIELIETAIVGSDLYLAIFIFNHNHFSLKMASYIFKLFILNGKHNFLIRTLILSEFAQKDRLFESVNEFNKPLFMIFTATAFQWITSIIDKINKVNSRISSIQSLELILNEIEKLDPESIFILRSILILSDLVFENVSTSFIILFHFLKSIVINVASAYKSKEMVDYIYSFFSQIFSVISNLTENERFVEFQTRIISEIPLLSTRLTFKNENGTVITISKVDVCQKIFSFLQKHADDFLSFMAKKIDVEEVHQVAFSFYYNIKLCMKNEYSIALPIHDE